MKLPGARFGYNRIEHQQDIARRGDARRRADEGLSGDEGGGVAGNVVALLFGLGAMALALYFAWQSGLF